MNIEGRIIGNRYEIIEKVGSGGMATVYKARDTILNRYVAVKVLRDEFTTDEEFIKRFNTEAQSAARLTHPNIVSVFDVGQEYNIYYIVMELIQGKTLKQIISEEGALPWKWTVNIAIQICSALEMAHKNGIVHRDIKPHNIIITEDGIAKVTDFGIAKAVSNSTITAFGTTIGSVHYFSPEHARGGYTDAKSDLYSLGVVMYEMITGKVPFDADTPVSVALKHMQEEPIEPIQLNSRVPVAVNQIILKAMKKDTSMRYESATEMMKDLSMALKNPTGNFVQEKNEGDFTKVIPTISENIISEDKYKANRPNKETVRTVEKEKPKSGLAKYLDENPKMKPVVYIGIGLAILLIAALIFVGSWKLTTKLLGIDSDTSAHSGISLPKVTSITVDEAKQKLDSLGIKYEIEEAYSKDVEQGKVISQKPAEGTNYDVQKNSPVKLVVSKGTKPTKMPKVIGKSYEEAVAELEKAELEAERVDEVSQTVQEGYVIKQEKNEGEQLDAGSIVKIYVSSGNGLEKVTVPYVVDMDVEEAKKALTEKKIEVNIIYQEDTNKSNGAVLKQSLEVGSVVEEGTAITITVNKIQELKEGTVNVYIKSITGYKEEKTENANKDSKETKDSKEKNENSNTADNKKTSTETAKINNVTVRINVDGEDVITDKEVPENTELKTYTIKGKGTVTIKVYVGENGSEARYAYEQMDMNSDNRVINVKGQY
ncbi:MAG: Stk1 family PASTA domain-containing Ser/Thr kinase [Clostridia bacterium]|nr:Stk1 family PASTA domain-containing Ser/Thr kinase [Clostridia bacterium]